MVQRQSIDGTPATDQLNVSAVPVEVGRHGNQLVSRKPLMSVVNFHLGHPGAWGYEQQGANGPVWQKDFLAAKSCHGSGTKDLSV